MRDTEGKVQGHACEMLGLLGRQVELYDRLQMLADQQRALIAAEDTQPLLKVLAQRKRLTAELAELSEGLGPFRSNWREVRAALGPEDRQAANELIGKADDKLRHLLAGDEHDARMLKLRQQRVGEELESIDSSKRALAAYKSAGAPATACFDQTHDES